MPFYDSYNESKRCKERVVSQITLRGIDPEIEQQIRQMAKERHQSLNVVLKEIIRQSLKKGRPKPTAGTLESLAGGWTEQEASDFMKAIESCEQIDMEMWS
jgi:hypothetical protein